MSLSLLRTLFSDAICNSRTMPKDKLLAINGNALQILSYSRRSDSDKKSNSSFKVVKSKVRVEGEESDFLGGECGPNWELLSPRGNRFYFPNAIGPAWQSASTTINLEAPLESLIDFDGKATENVDLLKFTVDECPSLIKKNLHELFPAPEVVTSERLALMTLSFTGDTELGASKFVLAAREITTRLRLHGYWADFMNPFSGKPFFSWSNGKNLYQVDDRFRGLNMKVINQNHCIVISSENIEENFSGAIYSNGPSDFTELKLILDDQL